MNDEARGYARSTLEPAPIVDSDLSAPHGWSVEPIDVMTRSGVRLACLVSRPDAGDRAMPRAVAVMSHAMFGRKEGFFRPKSGGIAALLNQRNIVTVAFDFRGHGESSFGRRDRDAAGRESARKALGRTPRQSRGTLHADWRYQDLVREDLPAVVEFARTLARGAPLFVVGHSLGGHVALAAHATGATNLDGVLACASNVWLPDDEPSLRKRLAKRALSEAGLAVVRAAGYFPARKLGLGTEDEGATYMRSILHTATRQTWTSEDGVDDYVARLKDVWIPIAGLASEADRLMCNPDSATRFLSRTSGPSQMERVAVSDDGGAAPSHGDLLLTTKAHSAWNRSVDWLLARLVADR